MQSHSSLCVCVCVCLCVCVHTGCSICAFAIYFSEWVVKYSNASCVTVCEREKRCRFVGVCPLLLRVCVCVCVCVCFCVCWFELHVCVGARWSVSWLALAGELEQSRGETGDLQERHAPLPPLLLFLFSLLVSSLLASRFSLHLFLFFSSSSFSFPFSSTHLVLILFYKNCVRQHILKRTV